MSRALRGHLRRQGLSCTAAFRLFAEEGLAADVASGGELHLTLAGGVDPARLYLHGNNKSPAELRYAVEEGVGHVVVDSFDEIERLRGDHSACWCGCGPASGRTRTQPSRPGQEDSQVRLRPRRVRGRWTPARPRASRCVASMPTSAHRYLRWRSSERLAGVLSRLGDWPLVNLGSGLGVAYTEEDHPPSVDEYVDALLQGLPKA